MTGRDRMVLIGVIVLAALGAAWMLVVSPERKKAGEAADAGDAPRSAQLSTRRRPARDRAHRPGPVLRRVRVDGQPRQSRAAERGSAVADLPALAGLEPEGRRVRLDHDRRHGTSTSSSSAPPPTAAVASFTPMPFTFVFEGGFFDLEHLFHQLTGFTTQRHRRRSSRSTADC